MIPVHILSGFLGSGKTTRLSRLLRDPAFARTAVIVNEFGEIGLDHELVETGDEQTMLLGTGCLCCAVQGDLARTLAGLDRRRHAGEIAFDQVVIETSGLADPAPILHTLMSDAGLGEGFAIGRVAVTVDAIQGAATLARFVEARRQVALANRLVLTKLDLEAPSAELLAMLSDLNPAAASGLAEEVGGDIFAPARSLGLVPEHLPEPHPEAPDRRSNRGGGLQTPLDHLSRAASPAPRDEVAHEHAHTHGVTSVSVLREEPLPAAVVPLFLEGLVAQAGDRLLRVKGLVHVAEAPDTPLVIHAVQHVLHRPRWLEAWPSPDLRTRIVIIGQDLPARWPGLLLNALLAEIAATRASSPG